MPTIVFSEALQTGGYPVNLVGFILLRIFVLDGGIHRLERCISHRPSRSKRWMLWIALSGPKVLNRYILYLLPIIWIFLVLLRCRATNSGDAYVCSPSLVASACAPGSDERAAITFGRARDTEGPTGSSHSGYWHCAERHLTETRRCHN